MSERFVRDAHDLPDGGQCLRGFDDLLRGARVQRRRLPRAVPWLGLVVFFGLTVLRGAHLQRRLLRQHRLPHVGPVVLGEPPLLRGAHVHWRFLRSPVSDVGRDLLGDFTVLRGQHLQ